MANDFFTTDSIVWTDEAKTILNDLKKQPKLGSMALFYLAETCSVLGQKDDAFQFLEVAYRERVSMMTFLGTSPAFDNLRSDPRYTDLLRRMGLPEVSLRDRHSIPIPNQRETA